MGIIAETKDTVLRRQGTLHPHPQDVQDPLFRSHEFFDPHDLLQVKYEMLRRVRVEGMSIGAAAAAFGFSRPTVYQAQVLYQRLGLPGLIPRRPGPRRCHKLTDEVMDFIRQQRDDQPSVPVAILSARVQTTLGVSVHRRTIERALSQSGKKTASSRPAAATIGRWAAMSRGRSATRSCATRS